MLTHIPLRQKRNDRGAALVLTVSIIGLAFIVTIAAFLVGASVSQNTERLASAKIDIATREDTLMRAILQQTATGMLPGNNGVTGSTQNWTTIMTNATTLVRATSYVDPAEVTTLFPSGGVIPANMADTGGTPLGIFQGYIQEVPFGGTSNVNNVVTGTAYIPAIQPRLMTWFGGENAALSASTAITYPQEFYLGSQYAGPSSAALPLSLSNRWAKLTYPNIRFGYKPPGDLGFIARRVWWRIPVVYQTTQRTVEDQAGIVRFPSFPSNYILSVYEIPSQLPISGNANIQIGTNVDGTAWGTGVQIAGSIYGGQIQLAGGTYGTSSNPVSVSARQQVNVTNSASVAGETFADNTYNNMGVRETKDLTRPIATTGTKQIGAAPVSVAADDGKLLIVPAMPGNNFYMSAPGAPTHWDLYARPYYKSRIRIIISGTNSTLIYNPAASPQINTAAGAITVKVIVLPDTSALPDRILGVPDSGGTTFVQASYAAGGLPPYMIYTSTGTGTSADRNILVIDIGAMVTALGPGLQSQLYSIYIGSNPTTEPATPSTAADPGIAINDTKDLSAFTSGLSIVTNQTLYLLDSVNQGTTKPPVSIYAPDIRYGISGVNPTVNLTGQVSVDPASTTSSPASPLSFVDADGVSIPTSSASNTFSLSEITDPKLVPPIVRLNLLFTIEKERSN
jgi:hypothetical protein